MEAAKRASEASMAAGALDPQPSKVVVAVAAAAAVVEVVVGAALLGSKPRP